MDLDGARVLVAGASGALGGLLAAELQDRGARLALAARDTSGLPDGAIPLELTDPASCAAAVDGALDALGGLDALVIATGAVAFGPADALDPAVAAELFAVNVTGPMALVAAALPHVEDGGIVALSAVVAAWPTAGMAAYSASKAALSAYLAALRREQRKRKVTVVDVRPPHLDTPFAERALAGEPPPLPEPHAAREVAVAVVDALRDGRREVAWDLKAKALVTS